MNRLLCWATLGLFIVGNAASLPAQMVPSPRLRGALGITMSRTPFNVRVQSLGFDSPAARAGLQVNDRILGINQQPVFMFEDVIRIVTSSKPGQEVQLLIERDGLQGQLIAVLGTELDAFGRVAPRTPIVIEGDRNPGWPPGYQPSRFESMPYQF